MTCPLPFSPEEDRWRWRWLVFEEPWDVLHRVRSYRAIEEQEFVGVHDGVTVCGAEGTLVMPGVASRVSLPRCARCCELLGVPPGHGAPWNEGIDL